MKERISKLEGRNLEMIQVEEERELRFLRNEESIQEESQINNLTLCLKQLEKEEQTKPKSLVC